MDEIGGKAVLVTGGAGFVGSALVRQLVKHNARVRVVDNLANGKRENLAGVTPDQLALTIADIRDQSTMARLLDGVDIVYHLACLGVRHSLHSPIENHEVNAGATLRLLEAARRGGVPRFVYVSSSEVYGTTRFLPITEDHPTLTKTVYGASKLAGENYARAFYESYGYATVVVRPFNAFGPRCHHEGDSGEVIPKFMLRCMAERPMIVFGDGAQTRDFTFVEDTAHGILLAGIVDGAVGQTINLGSGREISILDLARKIARLVGGTPVIEHDAPRPGDVARLCADSAKARTLLDYVPSVPFDEGLARLHEWYRASGAPVEKLLAEEIVHNWVGRG